MRSNLPVDFITFELVGGTPRTIDGSTDANIGLPSNCHSIQIESGEHNLKFKFVGADESPSAFYSGTDASLLPANSQVRLQVGVSSARVGSSFLFFDRQSSETSNLSLTFFMESNS